MRVLLVYTVSDAHTSGHPIVSNIDAHIGISCLSSFLKEDGHSVQVIVLSSIYKRKSLKMISKVLEDFVPEVVGFTSVSTQYPFVKTVAAHVQKCRPDIYRVIGGVHASVCPDDLLNDPFDAICVGEGEFPFKELLDQLAQNEQPSDIRNLWIKLEDGSFQKNESRAFIEDLDSLPFADRGIWKQWMYNTALSNNVVLLSRGCPFSCTYCSNHVIKKLAPGKYVRFRSPENILAEIKKLTENNTRNSCIYLETETILLNREWFSSLCRQLAEFNATKKYPVEFSCNMRICPQSQEEETFQSLSEANIKGLQIGLESGSESLRTSVLNRRYSNEELLNTVKLAKKYGMYINLYNLLGLPGETPEDHAETIRMNRLIHPNRSMTSIFYPYPGTNLHAKCEAEGLLKGVPLDAPLERRRAYIDTPTFGARGIQNAFYLFDWRIHKGDKSYLFRLRRTIRNYVSANRLTARLFILLLPIWHSARAAIGLDRVD